MVAPVVTVTGGFVLVSVFIPVHLQSHTIKVMFHRAVQRWQATVSLPLYGLKLSKVFLHLKQSRKYERMVPNLTESCGFMLQTDRKLWFLMFFRRKMWKVLLLSSK